MVDVCDFCLLLVTTQLFTLNNTHVILGVGGAAEAGPVGGDVT